MQWLNKVTSLLKKATPAQEYFLALILKQKSIKAALWEEKDGQVSVVDSGHVTSEKTIDEIEDDELLKLTDQAIGIAEKTLPPNVKTTKAIFGLPDWWIEGATIKPSFLSKIKKISKELELKPLGFVVIPEAISHFLKIEEGAPPTVLLVYLSERMVGVTLVRSGRIEAAKTIVKEGKSDSETVADIIKSFGPVEILPSRMLLFDGEVSLEEAKQEFISYPWTKELSFLHFPKIDIITPDFDAKAVVSGAAKEMGFAFEEEPAKAASSENPQEEITEKDSQQAASEAEHATTVGTAGQDKQEAEKEEEKDTFGFVKERDVIGELAAPTQVPDEEDDEGEKNQITKESVPFSLFALLLSPFTILGGLRGVFNMPAFSFRFWIPIVIFVFIIAVLIGLFIFIPRVTITLDAQTRSLEKDVELTVDTASTSVDKGKKIIPASTVEIKTEGEKSQKTTGKKTVGDKAKGEVIIYNKTENRKTFPKGTVLTGPSGLRFTLDDDVTVASTAAFELTPSSAKAKITADQIGEESNLPANTNLPFKDFPTSSYFAKNEAPLTGGTKRDIVAISKEDQDGLLTALIEELRNKAKDELASKSEGNKIVDIEMKEEIVTKKFSKDVGDEADSFSLKLAITFSTLSYKDGDLLELVGNEIERDVPSGFTFKKDAFETTVKSIKKGKAGNTALTIHYKATLTPNLDKEKIKYDIVGKKKTAVEAYLRSLPLEKFTISQNIMLPEPLDLLPQRAENITVEFE